MASSWGNILPNLRATLEAVDGVGVVETSPVNSQQWLDALISDGRDTACHVSIEEAEASRYTSGEYNETAKVILTLVPRGQEYTLEDLTTLRDGVISAMESDQTMGGYTTLVTWTGFRMLEASEYVSPFQLTFDIEHEWEA
ncbi:MAG: hypothetical protein ACOZEN_06840 [Thermodesulfobacteriota bacterium]